MRKIISVLSFVSMLVLLSCNGSKESKNELSTELAHYVSGFTSGLLSCEAQVQVDLLDAYQGEMPEDMLLPKGVFSIEPHIAGKAVWRNRKTIAFVPDDKWESGQNYTIKVDLSKLIDIPQDLKILVFDVDIFILSFQVKEEGLQAYDRGSSVWQRYKGSISTSDVVSNEKLEQILEAKSSDGADLPISWLHADNGLTHYFSVDSVKRLKDESEMLLSWNGAAIGVDDKGEQAVLVPAFGDFKLLKTEVMQQPQQYISLRFSDPLKKNQDFRGLFRLDNDSQLKVVIDGNETRIYPSKRMLGEKELKISKSVRNVDDIPLKKDEQIMLYFESIKPAVRLLGKGVISPSSQSLIFPFEAVSLRSLTLRIIQIYAKNVPEFLQENTLEGSSELRRVGRLIFQKKIDLAAGRMVNFQNWNAYTLDISKFIKVEQGAIYRVELRFSKEDAFYTCDGEKLNENKSPELEDDLEQEAFRREQEEWDKPGWYSSYYYPEEYRWSEKDNPCSVSYYNSDRFVSRNLLASDLGLIAKCGNDKKMFFAVSNLLTAKAEKGVEIKVYSYQHRLLAKVKTDAKGMAEVNLDRSPYLMIAHKGAQYAYLRLDGSSALSLSNFDVGGSSVQKGIKGHIYGERGVWRPGDKIYLTFVMEDKTKRLPENHPVIFELINPSGQVVEHKLAKQGLNGFYTFITATDKEAPTGRWKAMVRVGGAVFSKVIKIETVKPNRLKIQLDFGSDLLEVNKKLETKMQVKWLHGAVAGNLEANVDLRLTTTKSAFKGFENYVFDDPSKAFYSNEKSVFSGKVDEKGEALIALDLKANKSAPGMLNANFITRVQESGGGFSIDMQKVKLAPYKTFVGFKMPESEHGWYLTDTEHKIQVASLDAHGKPVDVKGLRMIVYKIDWRWWWDSGEENLASYIGRSSTRIVVDKKLSTKNGKAVFNLNIPYYSWRDYGRYLIRLVDEKGGHSSGMTAYFSKWYGRSPEGMPGNASVLSFTSDKEHYKVGEKAVVKIPSGKNGRALVSIETGSKVLNAFWVETKEKETQFEVEITPDMAPNAYVSVSLIQPHAQVQNDLPIRLYGYIPLLVEDPETRLEPVIKMKEVLEPEKAFKVNISEANGRPMSYTVAVVDEGLLDLTGYRTPDLWKMFYAREALGVKTWDMYDFVMGAFGARLEKAFAIGGDASLRGEKTAKANRFQSVVKFFGPYHLKAGATKRLNLVMPNYIGSVKTMVVAAYKGAYGSVEQVSKVRKPLMVLASLPRVLSPTETVELPVTVFAMDKKVKQVKLKIESNDFLQVEGNKTQQVHFDKQGEKMLYFKLKVAKKLGVAKLNVQATSGRLKANYQIEIEVRNPNPRIRMSDDKLLKKDEVWDSEVKAVGMKGTNTAVLELSNIPPLNLASRLQYLIEYPHGCIEQTTSAVFPQLYLGQLLDLKQEEKERIDQNIRAALRRLLSFQTVSGGLAYWSGDRYSSDWGSSYAGHFMLCAEEAGYTLPVGLKKQWLKYQKEQAKAWERGNAEHGYRSDDLLQAYRLYTLALANVPDLSSMNRLREQNSLETSAKWRLAAAYQLIGKAEVAKDLVRDLSTQVAYYREYSGSFGSSRRDKAMILETLSLMGEKEQAFPLVKELSAALSGEDWMSTQTTAYALLAMSEFSGKNKSGILQYSYTLNGKKFKNKKTNKAIIQIPLEMTEAPLSLKVRNQDTGVLYARVVSSGIPAEGNSLNQENNLKLSCTFVDSEGKTIDPKKLKQGTDFQAVVRIKNPGSKGIYQNLALSQIFPSGWEILNTRFGNIDANDNESRPDYTDIRDDRVYSYFSLKPNEEKTFKVKLTAAYAGRFYMPSVTCDAMYDNSINACVSGKWIEVVR